jgi:hypothetical protein
VRADGGRGAPSTLLALGAAGGSAVSCHELAAALCAPTAHSSLGCSHLQDELACGAGPMPSGTLLLADRATSSATLALDARLLSCFTPPLRAPRVASALRSKSGMLWPCGPGPSAQTRVPSAATTCMSPASSTRPTQQVSEEGCVRCGVGAFLQKGVAAAGWQPEGEGGCGCQRSSCIWAAAQTQ